MSSINQLSTREKEIAALVTRDYSEKMIGDVLYISPGTVHKHTSNIRKKLGVSTAVGIAVKYLQSLDHPKQFVISIVFLLIQMSAIVNVDDDQIRRMSRRSNRTSKRIEYATT